MPYDENTVAKLESQVDDMIKQLDDMLGKGLASPGAPDSDDGDVTGSADDNKGDHKRRVKLHDQKATGSMDKAKKKMAADEEDAADGGDDESTEDDWSEGSDSNTNGNGNGKKTKKAAPREEDDVKKSEGEGEGEAVMIEGQRIVKSEVGDAMFAVLKGQSEKIEKAHKDLEKAKNEAELATLRKRADDEFPHVPGSTEERALMLKAMNGMPEQLRKSFEAILTAHEKMVKSAFGKIGSGGGDIEGMKKNGADFETKVAEIQKRDSCTRTAALEKARKEAPDLYKAFQGNGN